MKEQRWTDRLMRWYGKNARDLPWRRTRDPYKIWISEMMLQQTTVATVIPYYEKWVRLFPTVGHVARSSLQKVLSAWQGLGYYRRARHLHRAAQIICRAYDAKVPAAEEELRKLPGFGPYTTAAVLSIAFNQRLPLIDANVRRVAARLLALEGESAASRDKIIYAFLGRAMPQERPGIFNQALMELGALICRSQKPSCFFCPLAKTCLARRRGRQDEIPAVRRDTVEKVESVAAVIKKDGRYLLRQRPKEGLWAGMWEFPGGEVKSGETVSDALRRHVREECKASPVSVSSAAIIRHAYTRFRNTLYVFLVGVETAPRISGPHRWVGAHAFDKFPMPSAHARIAGHLKALASRDSFGKL